MTGEYSSKCQMATQSHYERWSTRSGTETLREQLAAFFKSAQIDFDNEDACLQYHYAIPTATQLFSNINFSSRHALNPMGASSLLAESSDLRTQWAVTQTLQKSSADDPQLPANKHIPTLLLPDTFNYEELVVQADHDMDVLQSSIVDDLNCIELSEQTLEQAVQRSNVIQLDSDAAAFEAIKGMEKSMGMKEEVEKEYSIQELVEMGYTHIPWNGIDPLLIVNCKGHIIMFLAGQPNQEDFAEMMELSDRMMAVSEEMG
ncbi:hypothetical protein L218DRAFT_949209 [Marasmius fiardii PR-910]|nr:hypothetical protein L218DRAFT_949209 [Marasmius fiardii PR-910]